MPQCSLPAVYSGMPMLSARPEGLVNEWKCRPLQEGERPAKVLASRL